nr:MAG TPA: helix-turn-helix domain protein [Caudoviricetes sp.]
MNYIAEIKAFMDLVQVKSMSTGQIALWYALMYINNKCAWTEWFTVPNITLEINTGLSRQGITKCRNALKQCGIIDFTSNGTKAASYKLITMSNSVQAGVQDSIQSSVQDSIQSSVQDSSTLNKHKLNKTKQNKPPISPLDVFAQVEDEELRAALYDFAAMRKTIKKPMTERAKELLLHKLNDMSNDPKEQVKILNQSIMHNWQGVFALKGDGDRGQSAAGYRDDTQAGGERRSFGVQL